MAIIQKRADQLKPGDVIVKNTAYPQRVVVATGSSTTHSGWIFIQMHNGSAMDTFTLDPDLTFSVEAPDLTPAQQHAEELAGMLYRALASDSIHSTPGAWVADAETLLDKIKPPEPPTLAEALELLGQAIDATPIGYEPLDRRISQLLDRARRAGMLE